MLNYNTVVGEFINSPKLETSRKLVRLANFFLNNNICRFTFEQNIGTLQINTFVVANSIKFKIEVSTLVSYNNLYL